MKVYTVKRIAGLPDWSVIPDLKVDNALWLPDHQVRMTQQVCYDDTALYIHQRAIEEHIRAEHTSPLSQVCEDSCMEFFSAPTPTVTVISTSSLTRTGVCSWVGATGASRLYGCSHGAIRSCLMSGCHERKTVGKSFSASLFPSYSCSAPPSH